jgi:hypothetical protein
MSSAKVVASLESCAGRGPVATARDFLPPRLAHYYAHVTNVMTLVPLPKSRR